MATCIYFLSSMFSNIYILQDKFHEVSSVQSYRVSNNYDQNNGRKGKKTDNIFYSVREKQIKTEDDIKVTQSSFSTSASKNEKIDENYDIPIIKSTIESFISIPGEKEVITVEDDKSSISNVSTAISERQNKIWDEENINSTSKTDLKSEILPISDNANLTKIEILAANFFEITLQNGETAQNIKIYDV